MAAFNKGDRVRVVSNEGQKAQGRNVGREGTVVNTGGGKVYVTLDDDHGAQAFYSKNLGAMVDQAMQADDAAIAAERALVADVAVHVPVEGEFRPDPGERFQVMRGYLQDDTIFRVDEYAPITGPPEKVQAAYRLPELPVEVVHAHTLEKMPKGGWVATAFHAFPTAIMVPVGSTTKAFNEAFPGQRKPRAPREPRRAGSGRCEHCGEATKGGRFIPGHDAKLKGELQREGTPEAVAEKIIRGWMSEPTQNSAWARQTRKLVAQGDGFLRSRITARIGADPGRLDEPGAGG